jgi:uncharacterized protein
MMKSKKLLVLTIFCCGIAAGCGGKSPQVAYYHLSPVDTSSPQVQAVKTAASLAVGVGPVSFPEVLDRPQIVTRTDANRYRIAEFQRWGGSLRNEFTMVLAENLALDLNTESVAIFPWEKHFQPRFRVILDVKSFDGRLGESALLETRWTITDGEGKKTLRVGKSAIEKPVADAGYAAHIKGLDRTLKQLSEEIAAEIRLLEQADQSSQN